MMKKWMLALALCLCLLLCVGMAAAKEFTIPTEYFGSYYLTLPEFENVPYGYDNTELKGMIQFRDKDNNPVINNHLFVVYTFDDAEWGRTENQNPPVSTSATISDWEIQLQPDLLPGEYTFGVTVKTHGMPDAETLLEEEISITVADPLYRVVNYGGYIVSPALAALRYGTVEQVDNKLRSLLEEKGYFVPGDMFDGRLEYSLDNGENWSPAEEGMKPAGKVQAWIEFTSDMGEETAEYLAVHMFDEGANAGEHEFCEASIQEKDGVKYLVFEVTGNSPMLIGRKAEKPVLTFPTSDEIVPVKEGSSTPVLLKVEPRKDEYSYRWYQIVDGQEVPFQHGFQASIQFMPKGWTPETPSVWTMENDGETFFCRVTSAAGTTDSHRFVLKVEESSSGIPGSTAPATPPKTGDGSRTALWLALCVLTLTGAALCGKRIVRRKR